MRRLSLISAILSSFLILASCSSDDNNNGGSQGGFKQTNVANSKPGLGAMVVLGDSLAAGEGRTSANAKVPEKCLADKFGQGVTNLAVPGLTSQEILTKVPQAILVQPTLIFVSSGGNDAILNHYQPGSYEASKTLREMEEMFDALLDSGALVVYLSLNPPLPSTERLPQITELAIKKGVLVVDGMNGLWTDSSLMADQFHPNDRGYALMCEKILSAVNGHYP